MLLKTTDSESNLLFSNVQGESIPFVIGDSSVIIDIIRKKIYSYPIRTLVQEYLSNAKDSCLEAGKDSSDIEISLPTNLLPEFTIRDFGVGMSDERIREVFVQYGISTKRLSTSQLGYFGIGSKSGWAYTDSFVVESYHEGKHRQYIADIGDNKEGRLLLFNETETDKPNGVFIKIPVEPNDIKHFSDSFIRATCFWKNKPKVTNRQSITYPTEIFRIDDISFYRVEKVYGSDHNKLNSTVYFNANGIPFEVKNHKNTMALTNLFNFCHEHSILIAIKVNPAKLGISANRESFSEQDYADKKMERAYNKIVQHIHSQFEKVEPAKYAEAYRSFDTLTNFKHGFFEKKVYYIDKRWGGLTVFLKAGHLSKIEYQIKYSKSIERSVAVLDDKGVPLDVKIFLSRSKGILVTPVKGQIQVTEIEPSTKKALVVAKRLWLTEKMKTKTVSVFPKSYVFFRENMSEEEYLEAGAVMGATEYLEDCFKEVKIKFERPNKPTKKIKEAIYIRKFEMGVKRNSDAVRGSSYELSQTFIDNYDAIFYGEDCPRSFYKLVNQCVPRFCVVYANAANIQKLAELDNSKILPIEKFTEFIHAHPDLRQHFIDQWVYYKNKEIWNFLLKIKKALVSEKFDISKIFQKAFLYSHNNIAGISPYSLIKDLPKDSELADFLETYPLLTRLSTHPEIESKLYSHITFYMQSIDKGLIP